MTDLQIVLSLYTACSMIYVYCEHNTFEYHYENMPKSYVALAIIQQMVHYARAGLCWPLYIIEDAVIYVMNNWYGEEEDETPDL